MSLTYVGVFEIFERDLAGHAINEYVKLALATVGPWSRGFVNGKRTATSSMLGHCLPAANLVEPCQHRTRVSLSLVIHSWLDVYPPYPASTGKGITLFQCSYQSLPGHKSPCTQQCFHQGLRRLTPHTLGLPVGMQYVIWCSCVEGGVSQARCGGLDAPGEAQQSSPFWGVG